jgi:hypothetical protein
MSELHVQAIDMSPWIDELLVMSDEFIAAVEKRATTLESHPFPRAVFAVAASTVVSYRLCHNGPNQPEKLAAMLVITEMMDPFMADLKAASAKRATSAH